MEKHETGDTAKTNEVEDRRESFAQLRDMAAAKFDVLPPEQLAAHVLVTTEGADWPVQLAAMQAIVRRLRFAQRDELRIAQRPARRQRLGLYATRGPRRNSQRPYHTLLYSVEPLRGSCDCRDFSRSSLGLCKHLLVVLEDVFASPRKLAQARRQGVYAARSPLCWDPIRPLVGRGDWLEQVRWAATAESAKSSAPIRRAKAAFHRRAGKPQQAGKLRNAHANNLSKRAALIKTLLAVLPAQAGGASDDPALRSLLVREKLKVSERRKTFPLANQARSWKRGLKRKLYPYQSEGVKRFLQTGRLLLGDDMGLGKTTQAAAASHALFHSGKVRRGLIIVPASLKSQWLHEWQEVTDVPAMIVEGGPDQRKQQYASWQRGFLIMNYEQLLRDFALVRAYAPDMVVLDEAQRIKNWATKTATYVKALRVRYRLVLTGTPMQNRLPELASIYDWVDDMALEPKWRLIPWHTMSAQASGKKPGNRGEVIGARNLDTIRQRIGDTFLRRLRQQVLSQLPPRTETVVPVPMTREQMLAHRDLDQPLAALANISRRRPLRPEEFLRLMSLLTTQRMICNGMAQIEFEGLWPSLPVTGPSSQLQLEGLFSPKLIELRRLIQGVGLERGRKVVVFSQWRRMLRLASWAITDVLAAHGQRAVFFTGKESQRQRTRGVVELHDDPATTVMFLTDAGGVGLNLQRAASCCINLELPWNPAVLDQRIGRIHRLGQEQPVEVYNLVSTAGIEARISGVVATKKELFDTLFDGTSNELVFSSSGSAMAQIQKLITSVKAPDPEVGTSALADLDDVDDFDEASDTVAPAASAVEEVLNKADEGAAASVASPPSAAAPLAAAAPTNGQPPTTSPPLASGSVQQLLNSLSVRATPNGGIAIEAPAEAAATLASLFGKMAELLSAQSHTHSSGDTTHDTAP